MRDLFEKLKRALGLHSLSKVSKCYILKQVSILKPRWGSFNLNKVSWNSWVWKGALKAIWSSPCSGRATWRRLFKPVSRHLLKSLKEEGSTASVDKPVLYHPHLLSPLKYLYMSIRSPAKLSLGCRVSDFSHRGDVLNLFQYAHASLVLGSPELDTTLGIASPVLRRGNYHPLHCWQ